MMFFLMGYVVRVYLLGVRGVPWMVFVWMICDDILLLIVGVGLNSYFLRKLSGCIISLFGSII